MGTLFWSAQKYGGLQYDELLQVLLQSGKVRANDLNIRTGPEVDYDKTGKYTGAGIFTIVREMDGWGKLKSRQGWICLKYAERV